MATPPALHGRPFRIRTITAGVEASLEPRAAGEAMHAVARALGCVRRAKARFEAEGFEVQTIRVALPPLVAAMDPAQRHQAMPRLLALDALAREGGALLSIGPVVAADTADASLAPWVAELLSSSSAIMCSAVIASAAHGVHGHTLLTAASILAALAQSTADGRDTFRFAAAAGIEPGTPFFPVAWHQGPDRLAIGLESAPLVAEAFAGRPRFEEAGDRLRMVLNHHLTGIERTALALCEADGVAYGGIDPSPAPLAERSVAAALELLTGAPFGSASTLRACAIVTLALKSLTVRTCGYAGLMLPVLEDDVLGRRAAEGRYDLRDLLLYSSVCGTGLDVVPLPGDTPVPTLAAILGDVATLSVRLRKPLSARLCLVPGKQAGEVASFANAFLGDCVVLRAE